MDQPVINFRGSGFHILPGKVEAEDYSEMNGIQTENTTDIGGGLNVGWIDDNDWLEYNCEIQYTGLFSVNFRVASESQGGIIKFLLNGEEKFNQSVPVTGGWQSWITVSNFIDLESGQDTIRLFAQQGGFNINWFELVLLTEVEDENLINKNFELCQNYPNPFNPTTTINYSIPQNDFVKLSIYDMLGKEIETLVDEEKPAGNHRVDFNGSKLSSGIYFYQLNAGLYMMIKKMILLK
jgi:hypothetical protein